MTGWLSLPVALVIAVLVAIGTLSLFDTGHASSVQDDAKPENLTTASEVRLLSLLETGDADQKVAAIYELAEEPKDVAKVVHALARTGLSQKDVVRLASASAIKKIGMQGVEHIGSLLDSDDAGDFTAGAFAVQHLGVEAAEHLPAIAEKLSSDDDRMVLASLFAMKNMGEENLKYLDKLIPLLKHKEFNCQIGVCRIIERLGKAGAPAQDALVENLDAKMLSVRSWACIALGATGLSEKHDVVELLTPKLSTFTQVEKVRALMGLAYIGTDAKAALPEVKRLMSDPSKNCQPQAALTYYRISGEADVPIAILDDLLSSETYKRDCLEIIADLGTVAKSTMPKLLKLLRDPEPDVRELAVFAIASMGADAKSAIPNLKAVTRDRDRLIAEAAKEAIAKIKKLSTPKE